MTAGISAGVMWALATVILSVATGMPPLAGAALAVFVSTFLHDAFSSVWSILYNGVRGGLGSVFRALRTRSGLCVVLAALIGGPVGMTGYVMAIKYMGASVGAVASAIYPAIGSLLAYIFLKDKMKWYQWVFLGFTVLGVFGISYSSQINIENLALGLLGAMMCAFGWGIEAVILAKCLKDPNLKNEYALQIRQMTSALAYGAVILPALGGWGFTVDVFVGGALKLVLLIALAGLCATVSYLFYYKAIAKIGASKAMALNVTYCAWATVFTALMLWDISVLSPLTVICTLVVLVCGIFAAADFKEIFEKKNKNAKDL